MQQLLIVKKYKIRIFKRKKMEKTEESADKEVEKKQPVKKHKILPQADVINVNDMMMYQSWQMHCYMLMTSLSGFMINPYQY